MWTNLKSLHVVIFFITFGFRDFHVDAFLCGPDEELVSSPSGYPVVGNCEPCRGSRQTIEGQWSQCSVTCGHGTQNRITTHITRCGARSLSTESRSCYQTICPVNGGWSAWGQYTSCDKSCGGGIHVRFRTCSNPSPSHGGLQCIGNSLQTSSCNTQICPELVTLVNPPASTSVTLPSIVSSHRRALRDKKHNQPKRRFRINHRKINED